MKFSSNLCEYAAEEWDRVKRGTIEIPCKHNKWSKPDTGEKLDLCIFHAPIREKNENVDDFWFAFEEYFREVTTNLKNSVVNDREKIKLDCRGYIFPTDKMRFFRRIFPLDVEFENAIFTDSINFYNSVFQGYVNFRHSYFGGIANFNHSIFKGEVDFDHAVFKDLVAFRGISFLSRASFKNAILNQAVFYKSFNIKSKGRFVYFPTDIKGVDFSHAKIGENIQKIKIDNREVSKNSVCLLSNDIRIEPLNSADFSDVLYNNHNEYLRLFIYSIIFVIKWSINRFLRFSNKGFSIPVFRPYNYVRTKFVGVSTIPVDWSKNPRLGRDIRYQQFLHQFWERTPSWFYKPLYFLWWLTSRCGDSFYRWALWAIVIILLYGVIYAGYPPLPIYPDFISAIFSYIKPEFSLNPIGPPSWFDSYYQSALVFTALGLGDFRPINIPAKIFVVTEVVTGFIMLGALISFFANKLVRRD